MYLVSRVPSVTGKAWPKANRRTLVQKKDLHRQYCYIQLTQEKRANNLTQWWSFQNDDNNHFILCLHFCCELKIKVVCLLLKSGIGSKLVWDSEIISAALNKKNRMVYKSGSAQFSFATLVYLSRQFLPVFFFLFKGLTVIHGLGPTFILLWLLLSAGWRPRSVPLPATWWGLHPGLSWPGILRFVLHRQATCLGSEIPEDPPE